MPAPAPAPRPAPPSPAHRAKAPGRNDRSMLHVQTRSMLPGRRGQGPELSGKQLSADRRTPLPVGHLWVEWRRGATARAATSLASGRRRAPGGRPSVNWSLDSTPRVHSVRSVIRRCTRAALRQRRVLQDPERVGDGLQRGHVRRRADRAAQPVAGGQAVGQGDAGDVRHAGDALAGAHRLRPGAVGHQQGQRLARSREAFDGRGLGMREQQHRPAQRRQPARSGPDARRRIDGMIRAGRAGRWCPAHAPPSRCRAGSAGPGARCSWSCAAPAGAAAAPHGCGSAALAAPRRCTAPGACGRPGSGSGTDVSLSRGGARGRQGAGASPTSGA